MGKTGKIEQLSMTELFRLIDFTCVTGGLLVKAKQGIATVNFHQGEIVYVGLEGSKLRLGERMVEEKFLTEEQLRTMLLVQQRTKPWKPLGTICLENRLLTPLTLQLVVHRHMVALLQQLLSWNQGMFKFEKGEVSVSDPIALSYFDYLNYFARIRAPRSPVRCSETPMTTDLLDKCCGEAQEQLSIWRDEFFESQPDESFNRLQQLAGLTRYLRQTTPNLSEALLLKEGQRVQELLADGTEVAVLLAKSAGSYKVVPCVSGSFAWPAALAVDEGFFDQGRAGGLCAFQTVGTATTASIFTIPCGGQPLFGFCLEREVADVATGMNSVAVQSLRNFAVALNLAYLY